MFAKAVFVSSKLTGKDCLHQCSLFNHAYFNKKLILSLPQRSSSEMKILGLILEFTLSNLKFYFCGKKVYIHS